jgi:tetratricopeptide (TPR) repeat protein
MGPYNKILSLFSHIAENKLFFTASSISLSVFLANMIYNVSILHPLEQLHHIQATQREELRRIDQKKTMITEHHSLANMYLNVHDAESAYKQFESIISLDPTNIDAMIGIQKANIIQNLVYPPVDFQRAGFMLVSLKNNKIWDGSNDPHLLVSEGILHRNHDPSISKELFERALRIAPEYTEARVLLAIIQKEEGSINEAIRNLRLAHNERPYNIRYTQNLAATLKEAKLLEESKKKYERIIKNKSDYLLAYLGLSSIHIIQEDFVSAQKVDDRLIAQIQNNDALELDHNSRPWLFPVNESVIQLYRSDEKKNYAILRSCLSNVLSQKRNLGLKLKAQLKPFQSDRSGLVFDNDLEDVGILLGKKAKIEAEICRAS